MAMSSGSGKRSNKAKAGQGKRRSGGGPEYTLAEVEQHNTNQDCWVVVGDGVYDVTHYLSKRRSSNLLDMQQGTGLVRTGRHGRPTDHRLLLPGAVYLYATVVNRLTCRCLVQTRAVPS